MLQFRLLARHVAGVLATVVLLTGGLAAQGASGVITVCIRATGG